MIDNAVSRRMKTHDWSWLQLCFGLLLPMVLSTEAEAHRVYLYAWVEGDTVFTESYFGSKRKVQDGRIEVFDRDGNKLLFGQTNESGEFNFPVPKKTDLTIVVEAGMGHRGEYVLKAQELSETGNPQVETVNDARPKEVHGTQTAVDMAQLQRVIEAVLDKKLNPVIREIKRSRDDRGPRVKDVVAGIGYIFGAMGLILYFRSRKKG
jgi:nickel transport protein